jgi:hypothetical protein
METNTNNIENNQKYCCNICYKEYTRKNSLEKHKILCEFKYKTNLEKQVDYEEAGDIPTHVQLVQIVQQLSIKLSKMEEELSEAKKWMNRKKKKINVIGWLNDNIQPSIGFLEWVNMEFKVSSQHFDTLMECSLFYTIQKVFENNLDINNNSNFVSPICCFSEKQNVFYICEKGEEGKSEWKQMLPSDFILLLKTFHNRMLREISKWKIENHDKIDDNEKICEIFNKAIIKLMNMTFVQDHSTSRIRNGLFNYLKKDLKNVIEYDFEF